MEVLVRDNDAIHALRSLKRNIVLGDPPADEAAPAI
jgi:hypothetical protein